MVVRAPRSSMRVLWILGSELRTWPSRAAARCPPLLWWGMISRALGALLTGLLLVLAACASESVGSIGAMLARDNDTGALYVRDLSPGLAAERAGLLPGDEILMIDGRYVRELKSAAVRTLLRGDVGSNVDLTVVRGQEIRRIRVVRGALREASEDPPRVEAIAE
jgi:predicted metalloprotease with PDZ domain